MNEQRKKKYETPVTTHVQVEVENSICAASVTPEKGQDVATDRHVDINPVSYTHLTLPTT